MRMEFKPEEFGNGLEIGISGFKSNPTSTVPDQVYIEIWDGKLRVHVWDGNSEDPRTIDITAD